MKETLVILDCDPKQKSSSVMQGIFGKSGDKYQPPIKEKFTLNILSKEQQTDLPPSEKQ